MKRLFDVVFALALIVPASVIVALAALAIALDSPGPPLFRQQRVGRGGGLFNLPKLRTMALGTPSLGSHEVPRGSITRVGRFLRRTKIDELPQVWSVLIGDMSFVGPRPCLPTQQELITERQSRGVFEVRPGITGWAQIAGIDMSTPQLLAELDASYIATRSLAGDLAIMAKTILGNGRGDPAG